MVKVAITQKGRVVVVVPHGVLFRGPQRVAFAKRCLRKPSDAVIGLPEKLFSTAAIPVALMVFDRRRERVVRLKRKDILFVDASKEFEAGRNQNI